MEESLAKDLILAPFFDSSFSAIAYSSSILRQEFNNSNSNNGDGSGETATEQALRQLRSHGAAVDAAVRRLVSTHQEALVDQAQQTRELKSKIGDLSSRVRTLQSSADRAKADIISPHNELKEIAIVLKRVLRAQELLKRTQRLHSSICKLRALVQPNSSAVPSSTLSSSQSTEAAGTLATAAVTNVVSGVNNQTPSSSFSSSSLSSSTSREALAQHLSQPRLLTRVAGVLREVTAGLSDPSLDGVALVQREISWVGSVHSICLEQARKLLVRSATQLSAADVDAALQALHDLSSLPTEVVSLLDSVSEKAAAQAREAIDVRNVALAAQASMDGSAAASSTSSSSSVSNTASTGHSSVGSARQNNALTVGGTTSRGGLGSVSPPAGAAAAWRGALWGRCETLCEALQRSVLQAWNVVHVICRKRDTTATSAFSSSSSSSTFSSYYSAMNQLNSGADNRLLSRNSPSSSMSSSLRSPFLLDLAKAFAAGSNNNTSKHTTNTNSTALTVRREGSGDKEGGESNNESIFTKMQIITPHSAELHLIDTTLNGDTSTSMYASDDHGNSDASSSSNASGSGGNTGSSSSSLKDVSDSDDIASQLIRMHPGVRLLRRFLVALSLRLKQDFAVLATGGEDRAFVRTTLVDGYPRLHYLIRDVIPRTARSVLARAADEEGGGGGGSSSSSVSIQSFTPSSSSSSSFSSSSSPMLSSSSSSSTTPITDSNLSQRIPRLSGAQVFSAACSDGAGLVKALLPLQRLFLARSLSRMTDSLNAMFSSSSSSSASQKGTTSRSGASSSSQPHRAVAVTSTGFTSAADMERLLDLDLPNDAPGLQTTQNFAKAVAAELTACRVPLQSSASSLPPSSSTMPTASAATTNGSVAASLLHLRLPQTGAPDGELLASCARGVSTALRLLVAQAEAATAVGPGATAFAQHWMPTPSQITNHALACRLDEIRHSVIKACAEIPFLSPLDQIVSQCDDALLRRYSSQRLNARPLSLPLPPLLLALLTVASLDSSSPATVLAASSAQCIVLKAVESVDRCIEAILLPWVVAAVCPLERCVQRIHEHLYSSSSSSSSTLSQGESEWVTSLESCATGLASNQLLLLPQGNVGDAVRGMLCSRLLRLFNRHACLVRPLDDAGRMRLARDCAQLEVAVSPIWPSQLQRLGPSYQALRALRPFLFASSLEIHEALSVDSSLVPPPQMLEQESAQADKTTLLARQHLRQNLSHLRPCDILHHVISRLPRECAMPHSRSKMEISTYSEAMDSAAAASSTSSSSSSSAGAGVDSSFALARARLVPSQRALLDMDLFVMKGASACVDIDFVARAAVTGGAAASSFIEVAIVRELCSAK